MLVLQFAEPALNPVYRETRIRSDKPHQTRQQNGNTLLDPCLHGSCGGTKCGIAKRRNRVEISGWAFAWAAE